MIIKGELQRQSKLISSEMPFKILPNEIKLIKIDQAVLKILNFKIEIWTILQEKTTEKPKLLFFLEVLQNLKNNRLCDVRNDKCTIQQKAV